MAQHKSVEKILNFVQEQEHPITKTQIIEACSLPSASVRDCINTLKNFGLIEIWTNGKTMLIKQKRKEENATTN